MFILQNITYKWQAVVLWPQIKSFRNSRLGVSAKKLFQNSLQIIEKRHRHCYILLSFKNFSGQREYIEQPQATAPVIQVMKLRISFFSFFGRGSISVNVKYICIKKDGKGNLGANSKS